MREFRERREERGHSTLLSAQRRRRSLAEALGGERQAEPDYRSWWDKVRGLVAAAAATVALAAVIGALTFSSQVVRAGLPLNESLAAANEHQLLARGFTAIFVGAVAFLVIAPALPLIPIGLALLFNERFTEWLYHQLVLADESVAPRWLRSFAQDLVAWEIETDEERAERGFLRCMLYRWIASPSKSRPSVATLVSLVGATCLAALVIMKRETLSLDPVVLAGTAVILVALFAWNVAFAVREPYETFRLAGRITVSFLLTAIMFSALVQITDPPGLPRQTVETRHQTLRGLAVGRDDNSIYLGIPGTRSKPGRIRQLPLRQIREVRTGGAAKTSPDDPNLFDYFGR